MQVYLVKCSQKGRKFVTLQGGLKTGIMEKEYWEQRWKAAETGWDLGVFLPP